MLFFAAGHSLLGGTGKNFLSFLERTDIEHVRVAQRPQLAHGDVTAASAPAMQEHNLTLVRDHGGDFRLYIVQRNVNHSRQALGLEFFGGAHVHDQCAVFQIFASFGFGQFRLGVKTKLGDRGRADEPGEDRLQVVHFQKGGF